MTREQLEQIPDLALIAEGTRELRDYLNARGWRMTLAELNQERTRRDITPRIIRTHSGNGNS